MDTTAAPGGHSNGAAGPPRPTGSRARVAVSGLKREREECGRYPVAYVAALRAAGAEPVVLSTFEEVCDVPETGARAEIGAGIDPDSATERLAGMAGLVLTGGGDIDPAYYGQRRHPRTHNVSRRRDAFELALLRVALDRGMPVLAICRGMQLLNVLLGGTLEQHLLDRDGCLEHDRDRPRAEPAHRLRVTPGSPLAQALGADEGEVNSHHHQSLERVAEPLDEIGWAEDGVLEAVVSTAHPWVLAVQWHPEAMAPVDARQQAIFELFAVAAAEFARGGEPRVAVPDATGAPSP